MGRNIFRKLSAIWIFSQISIYFHVSREIDCFVRVNQLNSTHFSPWFAVLISHLNVMRLKYLCIPPKSLKNELWPPWFPLPPVRVKEWKVPHLILYFSDWCMRMPINGIFKLRLTQNYDFLFSCRSAEKWFIPSRINHIWTGLFATLKRLGGGGEAKCPPPNLAISSQMTMKLGKYILWVEIFGNWQKFLLCFVDFMTSSKCYS